MNEEEKKDLQFDDIENQYDKAWDTVSKKWSVKKTGEASARSENGSEPKKSKRLSNKMKRNAKPPPKAAKKPPRHTEKCKRADSDKNRSSSGGKVDRNKIRQTANADSSEAKTDSLVAKMPATTPEKNSRATGLNWNEISKRASADSSEAKSPVASANKVTPGTNHRGSSSGHSNGKQSCDSQKLFVPAVGVKTGEMTELEELEDRIMRAGLKDHPHELFGHIYAFEILDQWERYIALCEQKRTIVEYAVLKEIRQCWPDTYTL